MAFSKRSLYNVHLDGRSFSTGPHIPGQIAVTHWNRYFQTPTRTFTLGDTFSTNSLGKGFFPCTSYSILCDWPNPGHCSCKRPARQRPGTKSECAPKPDPRNCGPFGMAKDHKLRSVVMLCKLVDHSGHRCNDMGSVGITLIVVMVTCRAFSTVRVPRAGQQDEHQVSFVDVRHPSKKREKYRAPWFSNHRRERKPGESVGFRVSVTCKHR